MTDLAPSFSDRGAQNTDVAVQEARQWIEAVTGKKFASPFREALEDGVLLCELMQKVNPGSIRKINKSPSPIAHLDNIQQFLNACQDLGLNDAQLFDKMNLQESKAFKTGAKRTESDRRIRSVCITLYWLGRLVSEMEGYTGPKLDLDAFRSIIVNSNISNPRKVGQADPVFTEIFDGPLVVDSRHEEGENGLRLTFEQEQTADQLLADIQNAVDEMLHDFQTAPVEADSTAPPPVPPYHEPSPDSSSSASPLGTRIGVSVHMTSKKGGFGFQVVGGSDTDACAQVERVLSGSAAEEAGLLPGDQIVSVNKVDVASKTHAELISAIKAAGASGGVTMGLIRTLDAGDELPDVSPLAEVAPPTAAPSHPLPPTTAPSHPLPPTISPPPLPATVVHKAPEMIDDLPPPPFSLHESELAWQEEQKERERQAQELARMYPRHTRDHLYMEHTISLSPVVEETISQSTVEIVEFTPPSPSPLTPPPSATSPPGTSLPSAKQPPAVKPKPAHKTHQEAKTETATSPPISPSFPSSSPPSLPSPLQSPPAQMETRISGASQESSSSSSSSTSPPPHPLSYSYQPSPKRDHISKDALADLVALTRLEPERVKVARRERETEKVEAPVSEGVQNSFSTRQIGFYESQVGRVPSPIERNQPPSERQVSPLLKQSPVEQAFTSEESWVSERKQSPLEVTFAAPPLERKQSPLERKQSPLERKQSPLERKQSPLEKKQSPLERKQSPLERNPSPLEVTFPAQPLERKQSPLEMRQSPLEIFAAEDQPLERKQSPLERRQSPLERRQSPLERRQSPIETRQSPLERNPSPLEVTFPAQPLERKQSPLEKQLSPLEQRDNIFEQFQPAEKERSPLEQLLEQYQSPSEHKPSPSNPPKKQSPPPQEQGEETSQSQEHSPVGQDTSPKPLVAESPSPVEVIGELKIVHVQKERWTPGQHWSQKQWDHKAVSRQSTLPASFSSRRSLYQNVSPVLTRKPQRSWSPPPPSKAPQRSRSPPPQRSRSPPPQRSRSPPPARAPPTQNGHATGHQHSFSHPRTNTWTPTRTASQPRTTHPPPPSRQPPSRAPPIRSNTWSAREQKKHKLEGPQTAIPLRTADSHETCARCRAPLGQSPVMALAAPRLYFHPQCFSCFVCRQPLVRQLKAMTVLMQNSQLHCQFCYSNEQGVLATEC